MRVIGGRMARRRIAKVNHPQKSNGLGRDEYVSACFSDRKHYLGERGRLPAVTFALMCGGRRSCEPTRTFARLLAYLPWFLTPFIASLVYPVTTITRNALIVVYNAVDINLLSEYRAD